MENEEIELKNLKDFEESQCKHNKLSYLNGITWKCNSCNELFYIESCPF